MQLTSLLNKRHYRMGDGMNKGIEIEGLKKSSRVKIDSGRRIENLSNLFTKEFHFFNSERLSDKIKERFYSELNILFSAGIDIKTALEIIEEQQKKVRHKNLFKLIKNDVLSGSSLSAAMRRTGAITDYEYFSIRIGEESGRLPEILGQLVKFYFNRIKQKRQVISALSYPAIVLLTAFGSVFFMLKFVVPMFADVFKRFHTELPPLTKMIIRSSNFLGNFGWVFVLLILFMVLAFYKLRNHKLFRKYSSMLAMKIPVFGDLLVLIYIERFCNSMNLLLSSKTSLLQSVILVKKMIGFYPIEKSMEEIEMDLMKGEFFYKSISKFKVFDNRFVSLIKVGEEVNQLDVIFKKMSDQYVDEVEFRIKALSSLIEPLIILFLGIIVGVILVAMYMPLFQLSTSIH